MAHDELDLPVQVACAFQIQAGGHGGHNGLRDTIAHISARVFGGYGIGIGHPGNKAEVIDYVLDACAAC